MCRNCQQTFWLFHWLTILEGSFLGLPLCPSLALPWYFLACLLVIPPTSFDVLSRTQHFLILGDPTSLLVFAMIGRFFVSVGYNTGYANLKEITHLNNHEHFQFTCCAMRWCPLNCEHREWQSRGLSGTSSRSLPATRHSRWARELET